MSSLFPGDRFLDRYVILEPIGEGGMGVVYAARDENLRRTVAIKMLSPHRAGNKNARARLKREARAAAALAHPGIAQVFDVGDSPDGGAFLVMELVRGQSVRGMEAPSLPSTEALRIVREVARTLRVAHRAGLVHRDVKPDNIMIREDGKVMLLDFGIAKDVGRAARESQKDDPDSVVTAQGIVLGSPPYIAPEQISGHEVGPASDQFALAVVAFRLLTGKRPWDALNELGLLGQILMDPPLAASALMPSLPTAVDAVFERALTKEARDRFPDVEAFVDALDAAMQRAAQGTPEASEITGIDVEIELLAGTSNLEDTPDAPTSHTTAPPLGRPSYTPPSGRKPRWLVMGVALAVAAVLAGAWYAHGAATPSRHAPAGQGR